MFEWLAVIIGGIVTFMARALFLINKRLRPPKPVERYLPLVGPAVLGAIAISGILAPRGEVTLLDTVPAVLAAVVSWLGWRFTKQLVVGLVGGLAVWWGILAILATVGFVH